MTDKCPVVGLSHVFVLRYILRRHPVLLFCCEATKIHLSSFPFGKSFFRSFFVEINIYNDVANHKISFFCLVNNSNLQLSITVDEEEVYI